MSDSGTVAAVDLEGMVRVADQLDATQCIDCEPADPDGSYCGKCERAYAASVALRAAVSELRASRASYRAVRGKP